VGVWTVLSVAVASRGFERLLRLRAEFKKEALVVSLCYELPE
jgi:hypothetical protein